MYIHICLHCKVQFNNILNTFILTASGQRRHREVLAPLCLGEGHTVLFQSGGSCTSVTGTKPESEGLSLPAQLGKGGFNCNGNRCDQDFSYKPKDLMQQQLVSLTTISYGPAHTISYHKSALYTLGITVCPFSLRLTTLTSGQI